LTLFKGSRVFLEAVFFPSVDRDNASSVTKRWSHRFGTPSFHFLSRLDLLRDKTPKTSALHTDQRRNMVTFKALVFNMRPSCLLVTKKTRPPTVPNNIGGKSPGVSFPVTLSRCLRLPILLLFVFAFSPLDMANKNDTMLMSDASPLPCDLLLIPSCRRERSIFVNVYRSERNVLKE